MSKISKLYDYRKINKSENDGQTNKNVKTQFAYY